MEDVDKHVARKILTIAGYVTGFGKEELCKMFLNVKVNPLCSLVAPNYAKNWNIIFMIPFAEPKKITNFLRFSVPF